MIWCCGMDEAHGWVTFPKRGARLGYVSSHHMPLSSKMLPTWGFTLHIKNRQGVSYSFSRQLNTRNKMHCGAHYVELLGIISSATPFICPVLWMVWMCCVGCCPGYGGLLAVHFFQFLSIFFTFKPRSKLNLLQPWQTLFIENKHQFGEQVGVRKERILSRSWIAVSQVSWLWTLATSQLRESVGSGRSGSGSWELAKPRARAGLKTVDVTSFVALAMQIRWLRKLALD